MTGILFKKLSESEIKRKLAYQKMDSKERKDYLTRRRLRFIEVATNEANIGHKGLIEVGRAMGTSLIYDVLFATICYGLFLYLTQANLITNVVAAIFVLFFIIIKLGLRSHYIFGWSDVYERAMQDFK